MKKIRMFLNTGFVGCKRSEVVEFEDEATEEEIDEYCKEWMHEHIEYGWHEETEDDNED